MIKKVLKRIQDMRESNVFFFVAGNLFALLVVGVLIAVGFKLLQLMGAPDRFIVGIFLMGGVIGLLSWLGTRNSLP